VLDFILRSAEKAEMGLVLEIHASSGMYVTIEQEKQHFGILLCTYLLLHNVL